jgi:hypothetical protein
MSRIYFCEPVCGSQTASNTPIMFEGILIGAFLNRKSQSPGGKNVLDL